MFSYSNYFVTFALSTAYEFSALDYKIWNTYGDAIFAYPVPEIVQ